jgi:hypothetical protein
MRTPLKSENTTQGAVKSRSIVLSIFCLFGFVYFALLSILLLLATVYSGRITEVTNKYIPNGSVSRSHNLMVFIAGALLHMTAFAGLILIWNTRKVGYFLLSIPCLIVASWYLFQPRISISSTLTYILFIFIFGFFYRRLR